MIEKAITNPQAPITTGHTGKSVDWLLVSLETSSGISSVAVTASAAIT